VRGRHNSGVNTKLSKRMSLALRHAPERFGLQPDAAGWVPLADFLAALRISRADLDAVVATNDKQRFAVDQGPDGVARIRASQGHSIPVDLELLPQAPPAQLFHGTSSASLASIRATGLNRGRRHHVHLSTDVDTAHRVGARRSGPVVILTVDAAAMADAGHLFYRSANGVWLTDAVPPEFLTTP
jgi:putative RNA 2'-phosphotransferase